MLISDKIDFRAKTVLKDKEWLNNYRRLNSPRSNNPK